ncbi:MAG: hypothetical protein CVV25_09655 [Ignavibacteriae bacterium HGW-Ignavibacteriae-4]|jgi:hypothetical protein|nr:MAG: hypothetical protein CVV25_09655 [Ignavibacteriae bacterium HGW-Ignavibacteriae-4]
MKTLILIIILISFKVYSQTEYRLPLHKDTASMVSLQYNFAEIEKEISNHEKVEFLKELMIQHDTTSCYYFTGYETYSEFLKDSDDYADSLPYELKKNIHLVSTNKDSVNFFIYDRLNFDWDYQDIYIMKKEPTGWKANVIPGFFIVNVHKDNEIITGYETYAWACCDNPYDYYYSVEQGKDSTIVKSMTAFSTSSEFPEKVVINENKRVEMNADSLEFYALNEGKLNEVFILKSKYKGDFISEAIINNQDIVFVRFKVDGPKIINHEYDYFMGWVKKEQINYLW